MNKEKLCQVVGITSNEKDGKKSFTLHLLGQFADYEKQKGAVGLRVFSEWTRLDMSHITVGDVVYPMYEKGFQGMATLSDLIVYKDIKDTPYASPDITDKGKGVN